MSRLDRAGALNIAGRFNIPLDRDFHTLGTAEVQRVLDAARDHAYRTPRLANGSRARCFHAFLVRASSSATAEERRAFAKAYRDASAVRGSPL